MPFGLKLEKSGRMASSQGSRAQVELGQWGACASYLPGAAAYPFSAAPPPFTHVEDRMTKQPATPAAPPEAPKVWGKGRFQKYAAASRERWGKKHTTVDPPPPPDPPQDGA